MSRITIRQPRNSQEMEAMFRLRYQVYMAEGIGTPALLREQNGRDEDEFDARSAHWIALDGETMIGTVRVIHYSPDHPFMIEKFFDLIWPEHLKPEECAEGSRGTIVREYRHTVVFVALLTAMYLRLREKNILYCIATIKKRLREGLENAGLVMQELQGTVRKGENVPLQYLCDSSNVAMPLIVRVSDAAFFFEGLREQLRDQVVFE